MAEVKVFLAHGSWKGLERKFPIQEVHESTLGQLQEEIRIYNSVIKEGFKDNRAYTWMRRFGSDAFNHQDILQKLLLDKKAVLVQDGNCEGWGLSLSSTEESERLCAESVQSYTKEKEEKAQKEEDYRQDLASEVKELSEEIKSKTVYYYFKQDYHYRGMHSTFEGQTTVGKVGEFFILMVDDEDEEGKIMPEEEYWDWRELFLEQWDAVQEMLAEGTVVSSGEIGYHAISVISAEAAKEAAKKAFVETEF